TLFGPAWGTHRTVGHTQDRVAMGARSQRTTHQRARHQRVRKHRPMKCCHVCRSSLMTCLESGNCPCHWWQAAKDKKGSLPYKDSTGDQAVRNLSRREPKRKRKQR